MNPLYFLLGRQCLFCGKTIDPDGTGICAECARTIEEKHLELPRGSSGPVALYSYEEPIKTGVQRFKYGGRMELGKVFGKALAECVRKRGDTADIVTCVPRAKDSRPRMYNQSAVIAKAVAKALKLPFDKKLLSKRSGMRTQPQSQTRTAREQNAKRAFRPGPSKKDITGLTVLLIDDLYTTGATANACARILKGKGATEVFIYTAVRTQLQPPNPLIRSNHVIHIHEEFGDQAPYRGRRFKKKESMTAPCTH